MTDYTAAKANILLHQSHDDVAVLCADDAGAMALEQSVRDLAEAEQLKLGAVAQPLRAALTGSNSSPGIFEVLAILGRDESLARISDQTS